tara:strand:- start:4030 stop:4455 length:426 start_codon:yes stop_codon:yes gene_type:complete
MKKFIDFVNERKVKRKSSDPAEARSLMKQSKNRFKDLKQLPLNNDNASFRFEDAYEVLREALQSFLSFEGYKPYSHEAIFAFASDKELISEADIIKGNRYREIRNDINYRGKVVTKDETEEIISFITKILPILEKKFEIKN